MKHFQFAHLRYSATQACKALGIALCALALVGTSSTAAMAQAPQPAPQAAQTPAPPPPRAHMRPADFQDRRGPNGMRPGMQPGLEEGIRGGLAMGYIRPIPGAPYSATINQSHSQTLAGGVTIAHSHSVNVARDSQGRIRVETTITPRPRPQHAAAAGAPAAKSAAPAPRKVVVVYDPVAGTITRWNDASKTAIVTPMPRPGMRGYEMRGRQQFGHGQFGRGGERGNFGRQQAWGRGGPNHPGMGPRGEMARGEVAKSDLGKKTVDGVSATGEKVTHTIAAGTVGNDKPIVSTHERWLSPDLKIVLSDKNSDPFRGSSSVEVANLSASEPAADLFKAPADYTVHDFGMRGGPRGNFGPGRGGPGGPSGFGQRGPGNGGTNGNGWQGRNRPAPPQQNAAPPAPPQN